MLAGHRIFRCAFVFPLICAALAVSACGSSSSSSSSTGTSGRTTSNGAEKGGLSLSIAESGANAHFTAPSSTKGGLVTITLKNQGKMPHAAQLILIRGKHTIQQALKAVQGNGTKTPSWLRAEGGVAATGPGQTGTATLDLPAGHYVLTELGGPGSNGPPASTELQVLPGQKGTLPSTPTTVTAATAGKDRYKWQISGALKPGANRVTFESKGSNAIHLINAVRITGHPSKAAILKGLRSNGKPPAFLDTMSFTETAVLDGGKAQVTDLSLSKPGRYVLFCPLSDRDGGKPHVAEGLFTIVTVK